MISSPKMPFQIIFKEAINILDVQFDFLELNSVVVKAGINLGGVIQNDD